MMFLGCDISGEKQPWVQGCGFLGDEKMESDIIVITTRFCSFFFLPGIKVLYNTQ